MQKIQISFRSYSIEDIKRLIDNKELVVQPKFQRRRTQWPLTAKTGLLDSIMNNYPIPPIYVREFVNEKKERQREIIDGQQRITTILEFITKGNEWKLSKNLSDSEFIGYLFSELPFEIQQQILDYELGFLNIRGAEEPDIIQIFSRINSYSLPLNKQEKRNATYSGEFKSFVYDLSSKYYAFWTDYKIFTNAHIARMNDAELVSELVTIMYEGIEGYSNKKVDNLYKDLDQNFTDKGKYESAFNNVMSTIGNLYGEGDIEKQFGKTAFFFPLFTALCEKIYGLKEGIKFTKQKVDFVKTKQNLKDFVADYNSQDYDKDNRLLFRQGTGETSNRIKRHKIILKLIS
jgi:hypothetical protein